MTLEERIEKLELDLKRTRSQKRLTWGVAVVLVIMGLVVGYSQANNAAQSSIIPEIRARKIVLVDENGKPRCVLAMGKEGPGLAMNDENGAMLSILRIDAGGARLSLFDEEGAPRAVLEASKDGSGLALYDETGKPRTGFFVGKNGPKMTLFDKNGREQWSTPSTK